MNAVPNFATMPEADLKTLLRRLNVSRPRMAEAVNIKKGTFQRWMKLDTTRFTVANDTKLRAWLVGKTLADLQTMHSRNFSREVHAEVQAEVDLGPVSPTRLNHLKRRCEDIQEDSLPPPSKPKISKLQVKRIVRTKEDRV